MSSTPARIMRWFGKAQLWAFVALLALAVIGAVYQTIATEIDRRTYPPPGQLVEVGGRRLHLRCVGQGTPTVILEAANGGMSAHWVRVQREVARAARVCAYDRGGLGWSERGPTPRDARQISSELHTLLGEADIEGPYVLVGHSYSGLYVRMYAARYPDEVAVLLCAWRFARTVFERATMRALLEKNCRSPSTREEITLPVPPLRPFSSCTLPPTREPSLTTIV